MNFKKITLIIGILVFYSCDKEEVQPLQSTPKKNSFQKKKKAFVVNPKSKDTIYYEDLSRRNKSSKKNNIVNDLIENPKYYGLKLIDSEERIYKNESGFIVKKGFKGSDGLFNSKRQEEKILTFGHTYLVNGEETICDGAMDPETNNALLNSCPHETAIYAVRTGYSGGADRFSNISFVSSEDEIDIDYNPDYGMGNASSYYILYSAHVYTESEAWIQVFSDAMGVDAVGCITEL